MVDFSFSFWICCSKRPWQKCLCPPCPKELTPTSTLCKSSGGVSIVGFICLIAFALCSSDVVFYALFQALLIFCNSYLAGSLHWISFRPRTSAAKETWCYSIFYSTLFTSINASRTFFPGEHGASVRLKSQGRRRRREAREKKRLTTWQSTYKYNYAPLTLQIINNTIVIY